MAERKFLTVSDAVMLVSLQPMMDQDAQVRMENEGPAGRVYVPVSERQKRVFAMIMGRSVLNEAITEAKIAANKVAEQHGPRIPGVNGNGKA